LDRVFFCSRAVQLPSPTQRLGVELGPVGAAARELEVVDRALRPLLRGRGPFASLERWQTEYLPIYSVWAAIVVVGFPPVFGFD
jgi:hypothetical protein